MWNSERSSSSSSPELLPGGQIEVGEAQLGVASQAAAARELVDVDDAEPPGAAVQERSHFARLSLGLEFLGAHPQNAGGLFQRIKLSHGRAPRGRDRRQCSRFSSILVERRPRPVTSAVSGLLC